MNYRAYGLNLNSSVPLPALSSLRQDVLSPDLTINCNEIPPWATEALDQPRIIQPNRRSSERDVDAQFSLARRGDDFFELRYADGTQFLVDRQAARVWGRPGPGLSNEDLAVYLLGSVMGFALRRRGCLALHASAVAIGDAAIAIAGAAGSGKSTTAAALALRGWPVLCEDICRVGTDQYGLLAFPGYPRICLWPDSVSFLYPSSDALPLIVSGWEKRYLPLDGARAKFADAPLPLVAIYLLGNRSDGASVAQIHPISPREAALQLVQNTYMNWLIDRDQRAEEFDGIAKLVLAVECFRVIPSSVPARLAELAAQIEEHAVARGSAAQVGKDTENASCDV